MRLSLTLVLLVLVLLGLTPTPAWGQTGATTPYTLGGVSAFERGCFGSCACAVIQSKLTGSFDLRSLSPDPLYTNYAVDRVEWLASEPGHPITITGSGTYRVGGEFAVVHRMTLDLSVDGGPVQRYDSGDVPGGGDFPHIGIAVRLHDASACYDTVITVDALPGVLGIDPRAASLPRVSPNPFAARTVLSFALAREAAVDVTVLDLAGRRVRRLVRGERLGPGICSRSWDGADDQGLAAPAGRYRVRISAEGRVSELGVIKLR